MIHLQFYVLHDKAGHVHAEVPVRKIFQCFSIFYNLKLKRLFQYIKCMVFLPPNIIQFQKFMSQVI